MSLGFGRKRVDDLRKHQEGIKQRQLALAAAQDKLRSLGMTNPGMEEARKKARELADALNQTYSIKEFSSDGVVMRKAEFDAMERVVNEAVKLISLAKTGLEITNATRSLFLAVQDLERFREGGESEAIEGLLKLVKSLESS